MSLSPEQQFLLLGGGAPSAFTKHDGIGTRRGGPIVEPPKLTQQTDFKTDEPLTWPDGNPRMQLVVTVQTDLRDPSKGDDDGKRRFYIKGNLQRVVRDAIQAVQANGLEVGGSLFVTRTGQDAPKSAKEDGAWLYSAEYTPAAANFIAQPEQQAQPVAQPVQQQAVQYSPIAAEQGGSGFIQPVAQPVAAGPGAALLAAIAHLPEQQQKAVLAAPGMTAEMAAAMFPKAS